MSKKICFIGATSNGIYRSCEELINILIDNDFKVYLISPDWGEKDRLLARGVIYKNVNFKLHGKNPFSELKLLCSYKKILKEIQPDVVCTYTIKPNVYANIVCKKLGIPVISNITGLGDAIENPGILKLVSLFLYKIALRKTKVICFQNDGNLSFFKKKSIGNIDNYRLIPGSGVNLKLNPLEKYPNNKCTEILYVGRLTKDKGAAELAECIRFFKTNNYPVNFTIVGRPSAAFEKTFSQLTGLGYVNNYGFLTYDKIHELMKKNDVILCPSYHEGTANVLLEALSTGRPVIASNVDGCKQTFDDNVSGILFEPKNSKSLIEAVKEFLSLPREKRIEMGLNGRKKMEKEYDRMIIVDAYIQYINTITRSEIKYEYKRN